MATINQFEEESYSSGFEIEGVAIEPTLSQSFDPFSGLDVNTNTFQNTKQGLKNSNQDGRVPLGCFVFDEDNAFSDDFSISVRDEKFEQIPKQNLIINGNGAGMQSQWTRPFNGYSRPYFLNITPYIPTGTWGYCTFDAIPNDLKKRNIDLYEQANLPTSSFDNVGNYVNSAGQTHLLSFEQTNFTAQERFGNDRKSDNNNVTGSSGWYAYFFDYEGTLARPQVHLDMIQKGYKKSNTETGTPDFPFRDGELATGYNFEEHSKDAEYTADSHLTDADEFFYRLCEDSERLNQGINQDDRGGLIPTRGRVRESNWDAHNENIELPNIAKWIMTDEAYSHNKCLEFLATHYDEGQFWVEGLGNDDGMTKSGNSENFRWDRVAEFPDGITHNQYRSLNQVCDLLYPEHIVQHTVFEVKFKMKTDSRFYTNGNPFPAVELSMQDSDGYLGSPLRTQDRANATKQYGYYYSHGYWPQGEFNSQRYGDVQVPRTDVSKRYSGFGSMGRFQNTVLDEWEEFSYTFSSGRWHHYWTSRNVRRLFFMVQAAGRFLGRVLLDDFELIESYDFIPDCDVRKKISVGNYGKGDLTKYYDKDLQPNKYNDTTAPLEAQFYFYPTYKMDKTFDVSKTPMYRDFKNNLFYIYDVDWGDGSPREFTSEPEPINEEKAVFHQYNKYGIFEVTGTMIRMKPDKHGKKQMGIAKHKKFTLRININEGTAEDFEYFGSDGFSFIPFRNSTPIIGGYSEQSAYYKAIKRTLGFINDVQTTTPFKYEGDNLKSQIAFERMDSSLSQDLNLLNDYKQTREINGEIINNGLKVNSNELGKSIGDCDLTCIKYYNEPKSIWEMFGFENNDLEEIGNPNPNNRRYWKNIIPKGYSIFNRDGLSTLNINTYSEQDWLDSNADGVPDFYYPVLPKYNSNGRFIEDSISNNKIPWPLNGAITTELEQNKNLIINITTEKLENNVFNDISGNQNMGFGIMDYSPKFNNETLTPQKVKRIKITKTSTNNGAF